MAYSPPFWRPAPRNQDNTIRDEGQGSHYSPSAWASFIVERVVLPGFVGINGLTIQQVLHKIKGHKGDGGATSIDGLLHPEFDVHLEIDGWQELSKWANACKTVLATDPAKRLRALRVQHPLCAMHEIDWVVMEKLTTGTPKRGGPLPVTIRFARTLDPNAVRKGGGRAQPSTKAAAPGFIDIAATPANAPLLQKDTIPQPRDNPPR